MIHVFGYGSLMWKPGFPHVRAERARLRGFRRSLCILSYCHRGTPERPGLVFGLEPDPEAVTDGMAFAVDPALEAEVLACLDAREQPTEVYLRRRLAVELPESGATVEAWAYVVRRDHPQYAGRLSIDERLALIRQGRGRSGACVDYVLDTLEQLRALGIHDPELEEIAARLAADGERGEGADGRVRTPLPAP